LLITQRTPVLERELRFVPQVHPYGRTVLKSRLKCVRLDEEEPDFIIVELLIVEYLLEELIVSQLLILQASLFRSQ
jgi:hypothetical protein